MINIFKIVAFLEGLSYILLLFIAVPIKYIANDPTYVKLLGMPHGILFIAYLILGFIISKQLKLSSKQTVWLLLASVIPLATFYVEKLLFKK